MATSKRGIDFAKLDKALRKRYSPVWLPERPLLEDLLFACCLEDSEFQAAEDAFARVQEIYFDFNEIRVVSATELAEAMPSLADPKAAALRLKNCLQSVFEHGVMNVTYTFDLEFLKKENVGKAATEISKIKGASPFVTAFVVQRSLGGHAIPLDASAMKLFVALGAVKPGDESSCQVTGLERAIPKTKGIEFATLLHQAAVDFVADPEAADMKKFLKEVDPETLKRMAVHAEEAAEAQAARKTAAAERRAKAARKKAAAKAAPAKAPASKAPPAAKKKTAPKKKVAARSVAKAAAAPKSKPKKPR